LLDAGLTGVRTAHRTMEAVLTGPDHLVQFYWSHGQRAMWEAVPAAQRDTVRRQLIDKAEAFRDADGGLRFGQQVRHTLAVR